jgi:2-polyprenyl-3-methyl-5-hydroxy-6-metoxy-1,4-benzoquinol methylase
MADFASGWGSGPITDDGCAVEFYRLLPPAEDVRLIAPLLPPSGTVLDLGAGAGRLSHPLARAGFTVTAVDQSAEMLAHIGQAERVQGRIETLDLDGRTFDSVVLASYLLNTPDRIQRAAFMSACRRFSKPTGVIVVQVRSDRFLTDLTGVARERNGIRERILSYARDHSKVTITRQAERCGQQWTQVYTHEYLDEVQLRSEAAAAGLRFSHWLDGNREWFLAQPSETYTQS